ncbi:MAG: aminotransferase class III-fold pyridoxal phosphate-dependent enzyme [Coriobacteriales bacterium]|jgi:4-aminobutyrate aminotransferase-like enzyme|nr:aminotransferase class III-fold pyridoxal phosphate-dependent enzyme [Coriobacteriales bacterium]
MSNQTIEQITEPLPKEQQISQLHFARSHTTDDYITEADLLARINSSPFGETTKDWAQRSAQVESLGNVGWGLFSTPPIIQRAEGSLLYDTDDKEYIDLISGFSVSGFGNNYQPITEAICKQAQTLTHFFDFPHPKRIHLAERLAKLSGIDGKARVLFGTTGSDAIESAVKAARHYTGKPYVLVAKGDYHGATSGTIALTSRKGMNANYFPGSSDAYVGFFGFPHEYRAGLKNFGGFGLESIDELEHSLKGTFSPYADGNGNLVAAILVEPFQSSSGYYIPPRSYLKNLRRICDEHNILLILDEVQTGLGRTGKIWGFEHSEVRPDIIAVSKTLGGGLPLSAVIASAQIFEAWNPTAHINTQAGNAIACAAAHVVLDTLTAPGFLDDVNRRGDRFVSGLQKIAAKHPSLGYIDHTGIYIGLEFVLDPVLKTPAPDLVSEIRASALSDGLFLDHGGYYGNRIPLIPALNMPNEIIDRALFKLEKHIGLAEEKFGI